MKYSKYGYLNIMIGLNTIIIVHLSSIFHKFVLAAIVLSLIVKLHQKDMARHFRLKTSLCFLSLFTIWSCLSSLWSYNKIESNLYIVLIYTCFVTILFYYYLDSNKAVWSFFKSVVVSSAVFAAFLCLSYGLNSIVKGRMEYAFVSVNRIGTIMAHAAYISIIIFFRENKKTYLLFFGFFTLVCIWTGSRTAVLMLILATLVCYTIKDENITGRLERIVVLVIAIIIFTEMILNIPFIYNSVGVRFEKIYTFLKGTNNNGYRGGDVSTSIRLEFIQSGWEGFLKNPIVGYGTDQYRFTHISYSHSNFIELLYNNGIVGFLCFYMPFFVIISMAIKDKKKIGAFQFAVVCGFLCATIVESMFSVYYNDLFNWLLIIAYQRLITLKKDENNQVRIEIEKYCRTQDPLLLSR